MGAVSDELLLHSTGMKWKDNSSRKVNGALPNFFDAMYRLTHFPRHSS